MTTAMTDDPTTGDTPRPRRGVLALEGEAARGMDQGLRVLSYLIAGVVFYGGLGWLGDHLLHTRFLLPVGIVLGSALAVFMIIRRFGRVADWVPTPRTGTGLRPSTAAARSAYPSTREPRGDEDYTTTTEGVR